MEVRYRGKLTRCHSVTILSYLQGQPRAQHLTEVRLDSLARIAEEDTRWQWSQGRRGGGGRGGGRVDQEEVERAYQEDPSRSEVNNTGKVRTNCSLSLF